MGLGKDDEVELLVLPKARSFFETLMESSADASLPMPKGAAFAELRLLPELTPHLRAVANFLQLRGEPVWAVLPYRVVVK